MKNLLNQFGKPKVIFLLGSLLLVNLILFYLPILPGSQPQVLAEAPEFTMPDLKGIYSPTYVHDFLSAIGPAGRQAYQTMHLTTDLAFPFVYGLLLFALLSWMVNLEEGANVRLPFLAVLPATADLAENFTLIAVTASFPVQRTGLSWLAQIFTLLKFGGMAICLVVFIMDLIRRRQSKH